MRLIIRLSRNKLINLINNLFTLLCYLFILLWTKEIVLFLYRSYDIEIVFEIFITLWLLKQSFLY